MYDCLIVPIYVGICYKIVYETRIYAGMIIDTYNEGIRTSCNYPE